MAFTNPLGLLWGLLAVPIVILYLRRIRVRREPVATDMFWQQVFAERSARSAWQRWRWGVSLAVQLAALGLMVLALADPQMPRPRRIVLIVDTSAGMGATDGNPTRLADAKQVAGRLISGLRDCDQMAILAAGQSVGVRCNFTTDQTALQEAVGRLAAPAGGESTQVPTTVELARRMLAGQPAGEIAVLSDGCFEGATELADTEGVELIRVGQRAGNVALSRPVVQQPAPPLWPPLVGCGVLLLALEWGLYQRRWIC
jgi:hypothetical protein